MAALALIIGLSWKGSINLLFQLNEPFSMQLFPAFMLALLSPTLFHPWSLASGAMAGMLATIILEVIMTQDQDLADYALRPGISTFGINCVWVIVVESIRHLKGRYGRDAAASSVLEESDNTNQQEEGVEEEEERNADESFEDNIKEGQAPNPESSIVDAAYEELGQTRPFPNRPAWDKVSS